MKRTIRNLCWVLLAGSSLRAEESPTRESKEDQRYRDALAVLDSSSKTPDLLAAMSTLRDNFPGSRVVLVEAARRGSIKAKCCAIQILGEKGTAKKDIAVVGPALKDQYIKVRLTSIMALRRLGIEGYEHLTAYLPGETDPNNRKMAVKTLQEWDARDSVPLLVRLLKAEKDQGVRNFIVRALEGLTKQKKGDDVAAWEAVVDEAAIQAQARALVEKKQGSTQGK